MSTGIPQLNFVLSSDRSYQSASRTRQGYARKRILISAGYFFQGVAWKEGNHE